MQTFLPFPDFQQSAESLDRLRLGKQRIEVVQILKTLSGASSGWSRHPIVRAWSGYAVSLAVFGLAVCDEWRRRGYEDRQRDWLVQFRWGRGAAFGTLSPPWFGDPRVHRDYRRLLVGKDPDWYVGRLGWTDDPIPRLDYTMFEQTTDD